MDSSFTGVRISEGYSLVVFGFLLHKDLKSRVFCLAAPNGYRYSERCKV